MANKTITDYSSAAGIDPVNDYFLIESLNTYFKINRNTIMGVTGTPADISSSQSLSNKTIGNTNSITVKDGSFTLQNTSDTTKQVKFSLANVTTATTRTITLPNSSSTLATLTGSETLTNKTITGAAISGGTIDNSTITVDSISGHSTSTIVTIANLQISNGVLNSANAVTATSIAVGAVQPQALVTGTGSGWALQSYTPTLTNVTVGNGTLTTRYIQIGKLVFYRGEYIAGSTSSTSGAISISLPVTARTDAGYEQHVAPLGQVTVFQSGVNQWLSVPYITSSTTMSLQTTPIVSARVATDSPVTNTDPFAWSGANGGFIWNVTYEAA